jgi:hypothetical protein
MEYIAFKRAKALGIETLNPDFIMECFLDDGTSYPASEGWESARVDHFLKEVKVANLMLQERAFDRVKKEIDAIHQVNKESLETQKSEFRKELREYAQFIEYRKKKGVRS